MFIVNGQSDHLRDGEGGIDTIDHTTWFLTSYGFLGQAKMFWFFDRIKLIPLKFDSDRLYVT